MKNSFSYFLASVFILSSLLVFSPSFSSSNTITAPSNAFTYNDTSFSKIDEIYNGDGTFNENFSILLQQTSGIADITSADLSALNTKIASTNITASKMKAFATGGKSAGQDIVVRLGGLDWTPTYLSKTKSGDLILTMWLSNNEQDAFQSRTDNAAEGDFYGYVKSSVTNRYGLYSDWSADMWKLTTTSQGTAAFYPSNMYGTSYIRSVTLNNGGQYAISNTELAADPGQNPNSVFALFTMSSDPLSSFIATPSEVSWQEKQSATATNGSPYTYDNPNDEWNPDTAQGNYYSDDYNYVEHNGYGTWKNDKLWLPSMAETGYSDSKPGLWNPSVAQRANYNGIRFANSSNSDPIGTSKNTYSATSARVQSYLRSVPTHNAASASYLYPNGSDYYEADTSESNAVRPALHLNLTDAAKAAVPPFTALVSSDSSDPDIYQEPGENEGEVTFHIKSEKGLIMMNDYTTSKGRWNENWTFVLDNDIDISSSTDMILIGDDGYVGNDSLSFYGKFNGMGHTITGPFAFMSVNNADISNFTLKNSSLGIVYHAKGIVNISNIFADNYLNSYSPFIGGEDVDMPIDADCKLNVYNVTMTSSLNKVRGFIGRVHNNVRIFVSSCMLLVNFEYFEFGFIGAKNNLYMFENIYVQDYGSRIIRYLYNSQDCDIIISGCEFHTTSSSDGFSDNLGAGALLNIYDTLFEGPGFSLFGNGNNKFGSGGNSCSRGSFSGYICDGDQTTEYGLPIQSNWFTDADGKPHLRHFYWAGQAMS